MKQVDKPKYKGIEFDSVGEMHFYWWCEELIEAGYMANVSFHPPTLPLSAPFDVEYIKPMKKIEDKVLSKTVLNGHEYTADFRCLWHENAKGVFVHNIKTRAENRELLDLLKSTGPEGEELTTTWIETKPVFDQNNMTRLAVINQKWVMSEYGIFINIVIPEKLFDKTFTPQRFLLCDKSGKPRKIKYKNIKTLEQFITEK